MIYNTYVLINSTRTVWRTLNEYPSPLEAMKRMRMIILGKNPGILEAQVSFCLFVTYIYYFLKVNTQETTPEEYVVARVLEEAKVSVELPEESNATQSSSGSSFSSSGVSETSDAKSPETTDDAFEYIAGFIAKKFKNTHPQLGDFTYRIKSDNAYSLPSWVQQLSFGGLIKPSTDFLTTIKRWNKYFEIFHGENKLRKKPLVVKKLALKIKKRENLSFDVIKLFCKLRTVIRINYLKTKRTLDNAKKSNKRKLSTVTPNSDTKRKLVKKMRKTVVNFYSNYNSMLFNEFVCMNRPV
jgi:hypothetical protein